MKKLLLLVLLSCANICGAQCIVMTMNLDECVTCRINSTLFNPQATGLPTFVVFPLRRMADSADIEYVGRFRKNGIKLVFSDRWYERLNSTHAASCVYGLDTKGEIVYHQVLKESNAQSLQQYLAGNRPQQLESIATSEDYTDSLYYCMNIGTGTLKIYSIKNDKLLSIIHSSDVDLKWISDRLRGKEKEKFDTYGTRLNRQLDMFEAKFREFRVGQDGDIYAFFQYYNTPDSISKNVREEFCFLRYDALGKFKAIYPMAYDHAYVPNDQSFMLENENSMYVNLTPYAGFEETFKKGAKHLYYAAHFIRQKDEFKFDKFVPYDVPEPNRHRFFENYFSSNYCHFPYIANFFCNEIFNIKDSTLATIIPPSQFNAVVRDTAGLSDDMHFKAYGISVDSKANRLILPYQLYDKAFVNSYSTNLKLRSSQALSDSYIKSGKITFLNAYPQNNLLQIAYMEGNKSLSLNVPLDLAQPQ